MEKAGYVPYDVGGLVYQTRRWRAVSERLSRRSGPDFLTVLGAGNVSGGCGGAPEGTYTTAGASGSDLVSMLDLICKMGGERDWLRQWHLVRTCEAGTRPEAQKGGGKSIGSRIRQFTGCKKYCSGNHTGDR